MRRAADRTTIYRARELAPRRGPGRRAEFALAFLVCAFAPMNFLRLPQLYFTAADGAALLLLAVFLANRGLPRFKLGVAGLVWIAGTGLLISGLLVSAILHGEPGRGMIVSAQYAHSLLVIPFVFLTRSRDEVVPLALTFVASVVAMCLFGAYLIHWDGTTSTRFVTGNGRMRSFVERTNEAGALIAITLPLVFGLRRMGAMRFVPFVFATAMLCYGIMLTGSNSAVIGAILAVGTFALLAADRRTLTALAGGGGLVVLLVATLGDTVFPKVFRDRVVEAIRTGDLEDAGTFSYRKELILEALERVENVGFLGVGADHYQVVSAFGRPVHNTYLLIWNEGGLLALAGTAMILSAAFLACVRSIASPVLRYGAAGGAATVLTFAATIHTMPHVYARFWAVPIVLGLCLAGRGSSVWSLASSRQSYPRLSPKPGSWIRRPA